MRNIISSISQSGDVILESERGDGIMKGLDFLLRHIFRIREIMFRASFFIPTSLRCRPLICLNGQVKSHQVFVLSHCTICLNGQVKSHQVFVLSHCTICLNGQVKSHQVFVLSHCTICLNGQVKSHEVLQVSYLHFPV